MKRYNRVLSSFLPSSVKRVSVKALMSLRMLTSQMRLMPDFIIIGGQKCGTTSLYNYLKKHRCFVPGLWKEIHFFDVNFGKGLSWYRAHFPPCLYRYYAKRVSGHDVITGEGSPYYIFHPLVPERIAQTLSQVKLIALLRNPVDRAYSHYYHELNNGYETLSFEEAIEKEPERLSGEEDKILDDANYVSFNHRHYSYLARGIYVDQLRIWMDIFPKEQILILRSEDLFSDTPLALSKASDFLGIPDWESGHYRKYNFASYPEMGTDMRRKLANFFQPHNQRLYEFLGVDLGWDR